MTHRHFAIAAMLAFACSTVAAAQELPPVPLELVDSALVLCVTIDEAGVPDALVITGTGDAAKDRAALQWVKQLRWPPAGPGEEGRNSWFPMPIAFGNAAPLPPPPACGPSGA